MVAVVAHGGHHHSSKVQLPDLIVLLLVMVQVVGMHQVAAPNRHRQMVDGTLREKRKNQLFPRLVDRLWEVEEEEAVEHPYGHRDGHNLMLERLCLPPQREGMRLMHHPPEKTMYNVTTSRVHGAKWEQKKRVDVD